MEIVKIKGIVVNERNYKESSKILDVLTLEYGVISVLAKGAKKLKSPLRIITTKLTYADFQIKYKEGKISTLICADIINPFNNIKKDLIKISYATFILELAGQVRKQSNNDEIFNLLISALQKIDEDYDPTVISNILELKYLSYLGIKPNLDTCSVCKNTKILTVSVNKGGFICAKHHTNERILNAKTLKILRMLYYVDINKITKVDIKDDIIKEIDDYISEYYDIYTGIYLKSKKFLKSLKNSYI